MAVLMGAWAACVTPAPADGSVCDTAKDCKQGYYCYSGRCFEPVKRSPCSDEGACPEGLVCHEATDQCVVCTLDEGCPEGVPCLVDGFCGCSDDVHCPGICGPHSFCVACHVREDCQPKGKVCDQATGACVAPEDPDPASGVDTAP